MEREQADTIIPFYENPDCSPKEHVKRVSRTLFSVAQLGLHHRVVLVDDGNSLRGGEINIPNVVVTLKLDSHRGKAGAVREGIAWVLKNNQNAEYIIQSDCDGDPNPRQVRAMLQALIDQDITGDQPAMVLGERDEALRKHKRFDEHREALFSLQNHFCGLLGYPQIVDPTTGLRLYTRKLAETFIALGKAQGFGCDVEQLIIARLLNAQVIPYKLYDARRRADHTDIAKFQSSQEALMLHSVALQEMGLKQVVDVFGRVDLMEAEIIEPAGIGIQLKSDGDSLRGVKL